MTNKKIFYILGGIIAIAIVFLLTLYNKDNECNVDLDCDFFYTTYGENPCTSCSFADDEWICMNKVKSNQEFERIIEEYFDGNPPLCERCLESDYESYSCQCINNKCIKQRR